MSGIYARMLQIFGFATMTYKITINGKTSQILDDKATAYANYRAVCRDYANKPYQVKLEFNEQTLHIKNADMQLLESLDTVSANELLQLAMTSLNIDIKQLKNLIRDSQLQLSNSRIDGWIKAIDDRKFVQMHNDELYVVLKLMLENNQATIKSPNNIIALRKKLGLTQSELAEKLGLKSGHRQVARWEAGEQEMPDVRWKKMQNFLENE